MQDIFLVLSTLDKQRTPALSVSPFIKFCATRAIVSYGLGGGKVIKTGGFYGGLRRPRTWLRGLHVLFHLFLRICEAFCFCFSPFTSEKSKDYSGLFI